MANPLAHNHKQDTMGKRGCIVSRVPFVITVITSAPSVLKRSQSDGIASARRQYSILEKKKIHTLVSECIVSRHEGQRCDCKRRYSPDLDRNVAPLIARSVRHGESRFIEKNRDTKTLYYPRGGYNVGFSRRRRIRLRGTVKQKNKAQFLLPPKQDPA